MTPTQRFKIKKWAFAIAIVIATGLIFTFFAIKQISSDSTYQINTNRKAMQFVFDRVGHAYYSSNFNIARIKEFPEFKKYTKEAHDDTNYYNLSLLCNKINNELFKEQDRNVTLSFYCVGTNRVVSVASTQESNYFFKNIGTSTKEVEKIDVNKYFVTQTQIALIRYEKVLGQDVYWVTSFPINELFRGILSDDLYWSFFDRSNNLVYSNISDDANFDKSERFVYTDYYSGNYFNYYTPANYDYRPLISAVLYTFLTSFFLIVVQNTVSKRRFISITKELNISNDNVVADDIVDKIRKIKDESQVLEESFQEAKKINVNDSLKDYMRGVKTYIELEPEITETLGKAEVLLVCVIISPPDNAPKGHWKEIYHYIKETLGILVLVMTPEKLLLFCVSDDDKMHLEDLNDYTKRVGMETDTVFSIITYKKSDKLREMEGANFEFDLDTSLPRTLDKNEDAKSKMVQYIHNNYEKDISLADFAKYMEQTEKYASTIFKYETGTNFKEYLTQYRMQNAEKLLLAEDDVKIKVLARKVGYNSSNSFIRVFRNYFGVSPLSYKKKTEDSDFLGKLEE